MDDLWGREALCHGNEGSTVQHLPSSSTSNRLSRATSQGPSLCSAKPVMYSGAVGEGQAWRSEKAAGHIVERWRFVDGPLMEYLASITSTDALRDLIPTSVSLSQPPLDPKDRLRVLAAELHACEDFVGVCFGVTQGSLWFARSGSRFSVDIAVPASFVRAFEPLMPLCEGLYRQWDSVHALRTVSDEGAALAAFASAVESVTANIAKDVERAYKSISKEVVAAAFSAFSPQQGGRSGRRASGRGVVGPLALPFAAAVHGILTQHHPVMQKLNDDILTPIAARIAAKATRRQRDDDDSTSHDDTSIPSSSSDCGAANQDRTDFGVMGKTIGAQLLSRLYNACERVSEQLIELQYGRDSGTPAVGTNKAEAAQRCFGTLQRMFSAAVQPLHEALIAWLSYGDVGTGSNASVATRDFFIISRRLTSYHDDSSLHASWAAVVGRFDIDQQRVPTFFDSGFFVFAIYRCGLYKQILDRTTEHGSYRGNTPSMGRGLRTVTVAEALKLPPITAPLQEGYAEMFSAYLEKLSRRVYAVLLKPDVPGLLREQILNSGLVPVVFPPEDDLLEGPRGEEIQCVSGHGEAVTSNVFQLVDSRSRDSSGGVDFGEKNHHDVVDAAVGTDGDVRPFDGIEHEIAAQCSHPEPPMIAQQGSLGWRLSTKILRRPVVLKEKTAETGDEVERGSYSTPAARRTHTQVAEVASLLLEDYDDLDETRREDKANAVGYIAPASHEQAAIQRQETRRLRSRAMMAIALHHEGCGLVPASTTTSGDKTVPGPGPVRSQMLWVLAQLQNWVLLQGTGLSVVSRFLQCALPLVRLPLNTLLMAGLSPSWLATAEGSCGSSGTDATKRQLCAVFAECLLEEGAQYFHLDTAQLVAGGGQDVGDGSEAAILEYDFPSVPTLGATDDDWSNPSRVADVISMPIHIPHDLALIGVFSTRTLVQLGAVQRFVFALHVLLATLSRGFEIQAAQPCSRQILSVVLHRCRLVVNGLLSFFGQVAQAHWTALGEVVCFGNAEGRRVLALPSAVGEEHELATLIARRRGKRGTKPQRCDASQSAGHQHTPLSADERVDLFGDCEPTVEERLRSRVPPGPQELAALVTSETPTVEDITSHVVAVTRKLEQSSLAPHVQRQLASVVFDAVELVEVANMEPRDIGGTGGHTPRGVLDRLAKVVEEIRRSLPGEVLREARAFLPSESTQRVRDASVAEGSK